MQKNIHKLKIENLKLKVLETPAKLVVITGGEPLMHNLDELTTTLQQQAFKPILKHQVHIH